MKDLTKGSIVAHLMIIAAPMAAGMLAQVAYQLVDVYFVSKIGVAATAGVNAAGNIVLLVAAVTQILAVGVGALIAQAVGKRDVADVILVFNQSVALAIACGVILTALLYVTMHAYLRSIAADDETVNAGVAFVSWVLPGYAFTMSTAVLSAVLRGAGIVAPTVVLYAITVLVNAILAPILIDGWFVGVPLGVKGAGLATTISAAVGLLLFIVYFCHSQPHMRLQRELAVPRLRQWRRILAIGLPAGGDLALFFVFNAVVYYAIRNLGADAQAGFGIGSRVLQTILLPGIAICFAAGPIAGQNFGARRWRRVQETFRTALSLGAIAMIATTVVVQWQATTLVSLFDAEASALANARVFLELSSWALVAQAVVTTCSSIFQSLGNTVPSMVSSCVRLLTFIIPVMWLSTESTYNVEDVWYLSVATLILQAGISLWLLRAEFKRRLISA